MRGLWGRFSALLAVGLIGPLLVVWMLAAPEDPAVLESEERMVHVASILVGREIAGVVRTFNLGARLFDLPSLPREELVGVLRILYRQVEDVVVVVLLGADDRAVVEPVGLRAEELDETSDAVGQRLPMDEVSLGLFLEHLPIAEARERGLAVGGAYTDLRRNAVLVAGAVVVEVGGEPGAKWILGFECSLRRLRQTLLALAGGPGVEMFVVDGGGRLIIHPQGERALRRESQESHPLVVRMLAGERSGRAEWAEAETRWRGAFQRIDPLGWTVVVQRPLAPPVGRGWAMAAAVLALLLLCLGFLLLSGMRRWQTEVGALQVSQAERAAQLQRIQASLLETRKLNAIGDLGAGVAHEFNNPLGGILGLTQLLLRKKKEGDPDLEFLRRIEVEARRCKAITDNLLRFSEQQHEAHHEPLHIARVLDLAVDLVHSKLESQGIRIERNFEPELPRVVGSEGQLQRAFLNVLLNAGTAMPEGGQLRLATAREEGWVVVRISDTGRGIPAENLDRVFEPFFTTKEDWRGAGLGLWVVYQTVQDHEGTVAIESEPGHGTTVIFRFGAESRAESPKSPGPESTNVA